MLTNLSNSELQNRLVEELTAWTHRQRKLAAEEEGTHNPDCECDYFQGIRTILSQLERDRYLLAQQMIYGEAPVKEVKRASPAKIMEEHLQIVRMFHDS